MHVYYNVQQPSCILLTIHHHHFNVHFLPWLIKIWTEFSKTICSIGTFPLTTKTDVFYACGSRPESRSREHSRWITKNTLVPHLSRASCSRDVHRGHQLFYGWLGWVLKLWNTATKNLSKARSRQHPQCPPNFRTFEMKQSAIHNLCLQ